jgi:hypothetical protein
MWAKNHSIEWWTHAFHNPLRCVCKRLDGISWTTYLIIAILYCVNEVSLLQLVDARGISPLARTWMSRNARGSFPSSFALTHPGQGGKALEPSIKAGFNPDEAAFTNDNSCPSGSTPRFAVGNCGAKCGILPATFLSKSSKCHVGTGVQMLSFKKSRQRGSMGL